MKILIAIIIIAGLGWAFICAMNQKMTTENEQTLAYFEVFKDIYHDTPEINTETKYVAVDFSGVQLANVTDLKKMVEKYCFDNAKTYVDANFEELKAQGLATDSDFREGVLIYFSNPKLSENELVVGAAKWRSDSQFISGTYTVKKKFWFIKVRDSVTNNSLS